MVSVTPDERPNDPRKVVRNGANERAQPQGGEECRLGKIRHPSVIIPYEMRTTPVRMNSPGP